jgi:hypothetical protein
MSNSVADPQQSELANDLLWGAQQIADFIGRDLDAVYYLIRTGAITVSRPGGPKAKTLIASKRQLRKELTPKTAA